MKIQTIIAWVLRLVAAGIMLQTLYFKFTAHPQSVQLFTTLGMEPWGRIGTGVFELIASVLILYPRTTGWGAGLGLGLMAGAIFFHLTKLGIKFDGDYGLFTIAVIAFVCCFLLLIMYRKQVLDVLFASRKNSNSSL
ncbi:MAG: DoxX family protein [Chitinophagaceae bacterium]